MLSFLTLTSSLVALTQALVVPLTYNNLMKDDSEKIVIFYSGMDPSFTDDNWGPTARSYHSFVSLSDHEDFQAYKFVAVDIDFDEEAQRKFPMLDDIGPLIFISLESGVERIGQTLDYNRLKEFDRHRNVDITNNNVIRYESRAQILELANDKPVFLKMYEEWCGHCQKLKRQYQIASLESDAVHWLEIECSAVEANEAGDICEEFGVTGFPTLIVLNQGATETVEHTSGRSASDLINFVNGEISYDQVAPNLNSANKHEEL